MKIRCYACEQKLDLSDVEAFAKVACPSCQTELIVPKLFGEHLLEERLGVGTMATVYRAMDLGLGRENAVKVLLGTYAMDSQAREAYLQVARETSTFNFQHVIPIYSCGEVNGEPYIVMQLMSGGSLQDRMRKAPTGQLPIDALCGWFYQVILGLDAAAKRDILHHDLKPSNILFDVEGNVKVGDFNLSAIAYPTGAIDLGLEECHVPLVRSWYLAPEVILRGERSKRSDIYQLGAVMYHALAGKPVFDGDTPRLNLQARFREAPIPLCDVRPEVSGELSALVQSMLCAYPDDRPDDYAEIAEMVKSFRGLQSSRYDTVGSSRPAMDAREPEVEPRRIANVAEEHEDDDVAEEPESASEDELLMVPPGPLIWSVRVVLSLIALAFILLILGHLLQAHWYGEFVRPWLPGGSPVESVQPAN